MSLSKKAANDPPIERTIYAEIAFTPECLMLEYSMSITQAHEFLERHEKSIAQAMEDVGRDVIRELACLDGFIRYDDID